MTNTVNSITTMARWVAEARADEAHAEFRALAERYRRALGQRYRWHVAEWKRETHA